MLGNLIEKGERGRAVSISSCEFLRESRVLLARCSRGAHMNLARSSHGAHEALAWTPGGCHVVGHVGSLSWLSQFEM